MLIGVIYSLICFMLPWYVLYDCNFVYVQGVLCLDVLFMLLGLQSLCSHLIMSRFHYVLSLQAYNLGVMLTTAMNSEYWLRGIIFYIGSFGPLWNM